MGINKILERFVDKWLDDKTKAKDTIAKNKTFNRTAIDKDKKSFQLNSLESHSIICKELPNELFKKTGLNASEYLIKGSIGQGGPSDVPWICVFDKSISKSAQVGYYLVYLFDKELKRVYLSLNQGWTQYEEEYGISLGKKKISENSKIAKDLLKGVEGFNFDDISLLSKSKLAKGYELANICSVSYDLSDIPSDKVLINDLRNLLGVYRELKGLVGTDILVIESQLPEDKYQERVQKGRVLTLEEGTIPKKNKTTTSTTKKSVRNPDMSYTALHNADFKCEVNSKHETFISPVTNRQFVEAHHLIPMEFEDDFEGSIDTYENIISLCPNCHRAFHNSTSETKLELLEKFYEDRKDLLKSRNIDISLDQLKEYYKIGV